MTRLPPSPQLDWTDGVPRAVGFDDVYFSRAGGLAESEAVFLHGCGLPDGWLGRSHFSICELGFGAGVNVLAAWRAWKATRSAHAQLHISSIEAFPLARADAARALSAFPEIADLSARLLEHWPVRAYAPQRLSFADDGFTLTLFTGEAETILRGMSGAFDAWFHDGFAPARNPAMWSGEVLAQLARLSKPGARLATFTVAGDVRRGLEGAGFSVEKKPGFGAKRERLEAIAPATAVTTHPLYPRRACNPQRVAVLGAGIAGAAAAHALRQRGVEVIVLEAARDLGAGASGNPAGLVMPRLDRGGGAVSELFLAAYLHAVSAYAAMGADVYAPCGVEQRADPDEAALADLRADPPLPEDWFAPLPNGAALHRQAGLVRPQAAIARMLAGATVLCEALVARLERADDGWVLRAPDGRAMLKAEAVVLACGPALLRFAPAQFLPLGLSRGQIEWGAGAAGPHAITQGSYVAPFEDGVLFGATFDQVSGDGAAAVAATPESRQRNLDALANLAPELAAALNPDTLHSRAALRVTTPDRLPVAGLLPDAPAWLTQYAAIAHGAAAPTDKPAPAHEGVYVIGGLGARGLTLAPLLGECVAAEMCGEPAPLSENALNAVHPARFLHRALKRR